MSELTEYLQRGVVTASQLTAELRISPQTLMRRVRAEKERVVRIGRARGTRYGLRREVPGLASEVPLFRIDRRGRPGPVGRLAILAANQTAWLPAGVVFDGLPPEVHDMRPSGFMGRGFPRLHPDLPVPPRIQDWSDDHTLVALARRGEDGTGNLVLGDESMERWFSNPPRPTSRDDYDALAAAATAGVPAGSSAAGERPKFGAYVNGRHLLIKFAARGDSVAQRWQDLLRLEALALAVLSEGSVEAAQADLIETSTHLFLEVERFDRIGERGRRPAVTLAAVGSDLSDTWARAAQRLAEARLLSKEDATRLRLYESFARCIANPDRHHYNVVVFPELTGAGEQTSVEPKRYRLAPAFDQLPMLYAPTNDGQLPAREFVLPTPTADTWDVWDEALALAASFWHRASELDRLSAAMRKIAEENARAFRE